MRLPFRPWIGAAALSLSFLALGCGEDNEKTAKLGKGTAAPDAPTSQADMQAQMKGAGGSMPGYPGTGTAKKK